MKNKRTFLATLALGAFLLGVISPAVLDDKPSVDKRLITKTGKKNR
ncbi:hypothetical protein PP182_07860 [Maribacter sp. PR1]|uniref:Uncharacterized protein n=1 Tax=Maribacter cobaltidurans TaxID=1178778 RepID=A0ABU7ISM7_9FLAO|nr:MULTISPECIES: hypothetical protein [Maribacter]MDC6388594.1 hypothetical protein [Maribacter sp. PR1]MEE1975983.1 hypothetical protein [Maribacter cobaltidurans]